MSIDVGNNPKLTLMDQAGGGGFTTLIVKLRLVANPRKLRCGNPRGRH